MFENLYQFWKWRVEVQYDYHENHSYIRTTDTHSSGLNLHSISKSQEIVYINKTVLTFFIRRIGSIFKI